MFRTQEVVARRQARTGFGIVLVVGALAMLVGDEGSAALIMVASWIAAFATYRVLAHRQVDVERCKPDSFLGSSLVWPTIGMLLMLPLLIHLPFAVLFGSVEGYGDWVALSYPFTATTTFVAGLLGTIRALQLADGRRPRGILSPGAIYGVSLLLGMIPFGVFILPPILIALTGAPFISLFAYQEKLVESEVGLEVTPEIPAAIARWRALVPKGA